MSADPSPLDKHRIGGGPATGTMTRAEIMKIAEGVFEERLKPYTYFALVMAAAARALRYQADEFAPEYDKAARLMAKLIETGLHESGLMLDGHPAPRGPKSDDIIAAAERIVAAFRK